MHVVIEAPGKVNLCLLVGPRRGDGYHELFSVFTPVDLSDRLEFRLTLGPPGNAGTPVAEALPGSIRLDCPGMDGEDNLVMRALRAVEAAGGRAIAGTVSLQKGIPVGAGMGGGSSDAAAALRAAARLFAEEGGIILDGATLHGLARSLGADVPFFLEGRSAIGRGIGDALRPLFLPSLALVLVMPEEHLSTADVYRAFDRLPPQRGEPSFLSRAMTEEERWTTLWERCQPRDGSQPERATVCKVIAEEIPALLENDLEAASLAIMPELSMRKQALLDEGAMGALMSGSGPTFFGVCSSAEHAEEVAGRVAARGHRTRVVNTEGDCHDEPVLEKSGPPGEVE